MTRRLEKAIVSAINDGDVNELKRLIAICDGLHKGVAELGGYTESDLPDDQRYEEAVEHVEGFEKFQILQESKTIDIKEYNPNITTSTLSESAKATSNVLMYMDGIQVVQTIPTLEHVLLMPKFDGCSIGIELMCNDNHFVLTHAHTRGSDNLTRSRTCQDKTEYLQAVTAQMLQRVDEVFESDVDLTMEITYKDKTLEGNDNEPLQGVIDLRTIDYMLIRGEFVSNNKDNIHNPDIRANTQVGLSAGAINADVDTFNAYKDYITYVPFEIALIKTRVETKHGTEMMEYIPTQLSALRILRKMKMISYPFGKVSMIDNTFDMETVLQTFEEKIKEPLDGIVYCVEHWTYPSNKNEIATKVGYAKYKWKRHNRKQTRITDVIYSIGKTGEIFPSLIFEGVKINNRTLQQAKTTFSQLCDFIDECNRCGTVFGKGLVCDMELRSDVIPMVTKVYPDVSHIDEGIELISRCPYCSRKLTIEVSQRKVKGVSQRVVKYICVNEVCQGVLIEKAVAFFGQIKFKGIAARTLENAHYKDFMKFYESMNKRKEFLSIIQVITIKDYIVGVSLATNTNARKILDRFNIDPDTLFVDAVDDEVLRTYLTKQCGYFVSNLTCSLISILSG